MTDSSTEPTVNDMMLAYALDAVDHAKQVMGVDLDFTLESIEKVESILDAMFRAKPKSLLAKLVKRAPSLKDIDLFAKAYGGYIGEVLRRQGGGEWYLDEDIVPGQTVIGLRKGSVRIWPAAKVGKRLTNGPEDNVWHYYQVILRENWQSTASS
jgi:hypothetical protein